MKTFARPVSFRLVLIFAVIFALGALAGLSAKSGYVFPSILLLGILALVGLFQRQIFLVKQEELTEQENVRAGWAVLLFIGSMMGALIVSFILGWIWL